MARRGYSHSPQCVHDGCREHANYYFDTRAEQRAELERLERRGGWRCVRHTEPNEVLSDATPVREALLVVHEESYGKFWRPKGDGGINSGFQYGPGFKAYAEDFPTGTILTVTARVDVPAASPRKDEDHA